MVPGKIFLPGWLPLKWLRYLIAILLVLGIFFRVVHLDRKVYWHDENITSLQTAGYIGANVRDRVFDGQIISVENLQAYQQISPDRNFIETITAFAKYDPHHPPLYYIILRFWMEWFGSSIATIRSLSVIFSLLAFPCIYWLCRELFELQPTGWIAIALFAISPFHVLYAQEAREYSFWTVTILLSSAAFLRAIRLNTKVGWGVYGITLAIGFYSHLFFVLVVTAHGIYAIFRGIEEIKATTVAKLPPFWHLKFYLREKLQVSRWGGFALSLLAGILIFMPWLIVMIANLSRIQKSTSWSRQGTLDLAFSIKWWMRNLSHLFVDLDPGYNFFDALGRDDPFTIPLILALTGYALYYLWRQTDSKVWIFVFALVVVPAVPLMLPDLMFGGWRSLASRYFVPSYLGIALAIAYLLASQILAAKSAWWQRFWQGVTVVLISGGVLSCAIISQSESWWNKHVNYYYPQGAEIINQSSRPLVVSDTNLIGNVLSLSYLLAPETKLQLWSPRNLSQISLSDAVSKLEEYDATSEASDIFLFNPSGKLREKIESGKRYKADLVYKNYSLKLWKLEPVLDRKNET